MIFYLWKHSYKILKNYTLSETIMTHPTTDWLKNGMTHPFARLETCWPTPHFPPAHPSLYFLTRPLIPLKTTSYSGVSLACVATVFLGNEQDLVREKMRRKRGRGKEEKNPLFLSPSPLVPRPSPLAPRPSPSTSFFLSLALFCMRVQYGAQFDRCSISACSPPLPPQKQPPRGLGFHILLALFSHFLNPWKIHMENILRMGNTKLRMEHTLNAHLL